HVLGTRRRLIILRLAGRLNRRFTLYRLRAAQFFSRWRGDVRLFRSRCGCHAQQCTARNLEVTSEQQHERQGPDSEYNTIDEYREANSSEGSLEDEVELGDSVDGSERED